MDKKVIHPDELKDLSIKKMRIIIATHAANEVLAELPWHLGNKEAFCMVPIYDDVISRKIYDINMLLGYFRSKLIKVEIPTIFSNRCTAGFIYRALGKKMLSPTINTIIFPEDFLKMCRNPRDYFSEDMVLDHWTLTVEGTRAVGRIKDVKVLFVHAEDGLSAIHRWNKTRKWIKWDNMAFIMADGLPTGMTVIPPHIAEEFCSMENKHLLIMKNISYAGKCLPGGMFVNHGHFGDRTRVIESWFDLVGWINGEAWLKGETML